jgi:hypothetical protein
LIGREQRGSSQESEKFTMQLSKFKSINVIFGTMPTNKQLERLAQMT